MKLLTSAAALAALTTIAAPVLAQDKGFTAEFEALGLQFSDTDGDDSQSDFTVGGRVTFGYDFGSGKSVRLRYFQFTAEDETLPGGELAIKSADLEYAGKLDLGEAWDGELSAGLRWISMQTPEGSDWTGSVGPVIGANFTSRLSNQVALYAGGRQAFVFGNEATNDHAYPFSISEIAFGVEWKPPVKRGDLAIRLGAEAQYYSSVRDSEEDYGLVGWTLGARYTF